MEEFNPEEKNKKKQEDSMSRRDFLKTLGLATAGAVAAGVGLGKLATYEREEGEKHERLGEAVILEKIHHPKAMKVVPTGKGMMPLPVPEKWSIRVKINNKESEQEITEEEFNSFKEGDKIPVYYDDRTMFVRSLKK
jgi:hypothetical protein